MVALAYATRHPAHPSKLVLISTEAAGDSYLDRRVALFERFGGPEVGALARRRFLEVDSPRDQASVDAWRKLAFPVYMRTPRDPNIGSRTVGKPEVAMHWFAGRAARATTSTCSRISAASGARPSCIGGEDDPMHPIESQADIAAALPPHLVRFERFADCGHAVVPDAPRTRHGCHPGLHLRSEVNGRSRQKQNRRPRAPVLKSGKSDRSGAGVQHRDGAAVLRPARDVVADRDRAFLAVGDRAHPVRHRCRARRG